MIGFEDFCSLFEAAGEDAKSVITVYFLENIIFRAYLKVKERREIMKISQ